MQLHLRMDYSKTPPFENQPVLVLIQGCYFQKQPEMFLNFIDKKLFTSILNIFISSF